MYFETAFWGIWDKLAMISWERHYPYVSGSRKVKKFFSGVEYESLWKIAQLGQKLVTAASPSGMLTSWASHLQKKVAKPPQQWPYHHIHTYLIHLLRLKIIALWEPHLIPSSLYPGQCVYPFFIPFLSLDRVLTQALGHIAWFNH